MVATRSKKAVTAKPAAKAQSNTKSTTKPKDTTEPINQALAKPNGVTESIKDTSAVKSTVKKSAQNGSGPAKAAKEVKSKATKATTTTSKATKTPKTARPSGSGPNVSKTITMGNTKLAVGPKRQVDDEDAEAPPNKRQMISDSPLSSSESPESAPVPKAKAVLKAKAVAKPKLVAKPKAVDKPKAKPKAKPKPKARAPVVKKAKVVPKRDIINQVPTIRLDIYVAGEGGQGELGLGVGKGSSSAPRPKLNTLLSSATVGVVQIDTGGMHCAALTHDNQILTWGVNDEGALGRDTTWDGGMIDIDDANSDASSDVPEMNPREARPTAVEFVDLPEGTKFVQVVAADSATFALTDDGFVYGWGTFRGNDGIIGFSPFIMVQLRPVLLPTLPRVSKLAAGANHILALTSHRGDVYTWGAGEQHQLGRRIVQRNRLHGLNPRQFGLPSGIVDIVAGDNHSFALDYDGRVFGWGLNNYGQTGIAEGAGGDDAAVLHPTVITTFPNHNPNSNDYIASLAAGPFHSLAITTSGQLLAWGRVDGFQTGIPLSTLPSAHTLHDARGRVKILTHPTTIPTPNHNHITNVAAGTDFSIAVDQQGKAWAWGFGDGYRTGLGVEEDVETPKEVVGKELQGRKMVFAKAGAQFCVLAAEAQLGN